MPPLPWRLAPHCTKPAHCLAPHTLSNARWRANLAAATLRGQESQVSGGPASPRVTPAQERMRAGLGSGAPRPLFMYEAPFMFPRVARSPRRQHPSCPGATNAVVSSTSAFGNHERQRATHEPQCPTSTTPTSMTSSLTCADSASLARPSGDTRPRRDCQCTSQCRSDWSSRPPARIVESRSTSRGLRPVCPYEERRD
jgi:hypothetical protein